MAGLEFLMIDAVDDRDVFIGCGRGDENFFGTCLNVLFGVSFLGEAARAFHRYIDAEIAPAELGRIADLQTLHALAVDDQVVAVGFNVAVEAAMHGIVFQQMRIGFRVGEIIDGDNFDIVAAGFESGAENQSANTAKTIDGNANRSQTFRVFAETLSLVGF